MNEYYLLSLKWSKGKEEYVWWGSNDSGYTNDIQLAGVYTEERINKRKLYYCNTNTMPIPVELVNQAKKQVVIPTLIENFELFDIEEHLKIAKES